MIQQIAVGILFLGALTYLVHLVVRTLRAREGCASGCGKCRVETSALPAVKPKP